MTPIKLCPICKLVPLPSQIEWKCDSHPEVSVSVMGINQDRTEGWVMCAPCVHARAIASQIIEWVRADHRDKWHIANSPTCAMCGLIEEYDRQVQRHGPAND